MTRLIPTAVLALAFIAGGSWMLTGPAENLEDLPLGAAFAQTDDDAAQIDTSVVADMVQGAEDAPVTVTEYASYTCPHCARFHQEVYPELKPLIDSGQVKFVYREVYFDLPGLWASMVARCGGDMRFFGITDMIYERQSDWTQGDGNAIAENLRRIGRAAGLGDEQIDTCFSDAETAQTLIAWYEENSEADDINSTPSFLINGEKFEGNWDSGLIPAIEEAMPAE